MRILASILIIALLFSCKGETKVEEPTSVEQNQELTVQKTVAQSTSNLPLASTLMTKSFVSDIFGIDEALVEHKDVSPSKESKGCFYKWDDPNVPNGGILVRLMANPVADEFPNWPESFIQSKITSGEGTQDGVKVLFKPFEGLGVDGAYNDELGKYFWRSSDDVIFMIAYNLSLSDRKKRSYARKMGKEIMKNYKG